MARGHPIFAACYRLFGGLADRGGFAGHRRRLLIGARGVVVEIGAGTGLNFPWYPAGVEVVATESPAAGCCWSTSARATRPGMRLTRPGIAGVARKPVG
jgi:hypothetical protein